MVGSRRPRPERITYAKSVGGYQIIVRHRWTGKVALTVLDYDGRLIIRVNMNQSEWKKLKA